jgi:hypothetical protein
MALMVSFSIATSYCFPVRLSVMVKVFALMACPLQVAGRFAVLDSRAD